MLTLPVLKPEESLKTKSIGTLMMSWLTASPSHQSWYWEWKRTGTSLFTCLPRKQSSWGQHGAQLGPVGYRWALVGPMNLAIRVTMELTMLWDGNDKINASFCSSWCYPWWFVHKHLHLCHQDILPVARKRMPCYTTSWQVQVHNTINCSKHWTWNTMPWDWAKKALKGVRWVDCPHSKVHGANKWPLWDRQDTGGPLVGPMNFAICADTRYCDY